jgi:UDP-glucose 4-epimerase
MEILAPLLKDTCWTKLKNNMKVVVTGGAGFIGSHVVDAFLTKGDEVVIIDHFKKEKLRFIPEGIRVLKCSIASEEALQFIAEFKPDLVCHLAAQISAPASVQNPVYDAQVNITDGVALLHACVQAGVKQFFSTSSCAVYGRSPELPLNEESVQIPESPYAVSKQSFEGYLRYVNDAFGIQTIAFRPANVYGPRQQTVGEAGVVAIFLEKILKGEMGQILGDGGATRDYIYVEDVARAFVQASDTSFSGALNLGTSAQTSVNDLWESLSALHGEQTQAMHMPARKGDIYHSYLSAARAKEAINWEPRVLLAQGLQNTYDWFAAYGI